MCDATCERLLPTHKSEHPSVAEKNFMLPWGLEKERKEAFQSF